MLMFSVDFFLHFTLVIFHDNSTRQCRYRLPLAYIEQFRLLISPKHDDVKNRNKPAALCIVGSGTLTFKAKMAGLSHNAKRAWFVLVFDVIMRWVYCLPAILMLPEYGNTVHNILLRREIEF